MTILKITSKASTFLPTRNGWSPRLFVTASPRLSASKKEKEKEETCRKVEEAAEAVKEGANAVKKTCEFVKEKVAPTADSVNKMSKEMTDKAKDIVAGASKATTEVIKDRIAKNVDN